MQLVLEMLTARQFITPDLCRKIFGPAGGVIGRGMIATGSFRTASASCPSVTHE